MPEGLAVPTLAEGREGARDRRHPDSDDRADAAQGGSTPRKFRPGRHGSREWELTRWFKRVAVFLDGACHLANHQGEIETLLTVPLDADGRSMTHWGVRRWRGGPWELDNLELDYQLRHNPSALLAALEAFAALLHTAGLRADPSPWQLVG